MKGLKQDTPPPPADHGNDGIAESRSSKRYSWPILLSIVVFGWLWYHRRLPSSSHPPLPPSIFKHLGQYSPYFPVAEYTPPPHGCIIDQVNILMRHGARYPTAGAGRIIRHTVDKLKNASLKEGSDSSEMKFLKSYRYDLGEEDLVPLGVQEARQAARETFERYTNLVQERGVFMRSSSSGRVQRTANEWRRGFLHASNGSISVLPPLVISDAAGSNDTLANNGCPNHLPSHAHWEYASHFTSPIISRLEAKLGGSIELSKWDIITLFGLCAFESVAKERESDFCGLFTEEEILDFEYYQDLEKYYNRGYGNPLGPVEGIGYINELLARLIDSPVSDNSQTNTTLDNDPTTFPLRKGVYADFSHDNTIAAIVSALGLFQDPSALPKTHRVLTRNWQFGHIAPFGGRIVFERLSCSGTPSIRILGNDAVLPLPFCADAGEEDGKVCSMDKFVRSQSFARVDGQELWKKCRWRPAEKEGEESKVRHDSMEA